VVAPVQKPLTSAGYTLDQATEMAKKMGAAVVPTLCGMCGPAANCGIYAFVKDGRFITVAGMQEAPINQGGLCAKAYGAPQWVYSPDRLTHPLRRIGAKGEGRFEKISWEQALDAIADTLQNQKARYGPESLAILAPARRSYSDYLYRFLIAHGSPNYGHSGICHVQRDFAFSYTLGGFPKPEYDHSDLIIYWGRQPVFSGPPMTASRALVRARQRGTKIITIKPSAEPDTGLADIWMPIRPGTDAALAIAMLHVVVGENLIDEDFVARWCHGYETLQPHLEPYTPAWAETITGVPAGQIESVARQYATTPKACIDLGNGVEHAPASNDAIRSVAILMAVTGHLDRPGGNLLKGPKEHGNAAGPRGVHLRQRYTQDWVERLVGAEFPKAFQPFKAGTSSAYYRVLDSVLTEKPYPVRTIIAPGTQALASTRGSPRVARALEKLDFFVVIDATRTADMPYADIVLPAATSYETDHPCSWRATR